jgi:hypothetical protein
MKKISTILILTLVLSMIPMVVGAEEEIKVSIDGTYLEFADQQPILQDGSTLVPIRFIFEALDIQLRWEEETSTVFAIKDNTIIVLQINNPNVFVNERSFELNVPATLINGRTMVPIRFIAETTGATVEWVEEESKVVITTKEEDKTNEETKNNDKDTNEQIPVDEHEDSNIEDEYSFQEDLEKEFVFEDEDFFDEDFE